MRVPLRYVAASALVGAALVVGCGTIFAFYLSALAGECASIPAEVWERTLKSTLILGPPLATFLVLATVAWLWRWRTGILPWVAGALGIVLLARRDAGILSTPDLVLSALLLLAAALAGRRRPEE